MRKGAEKPYEVINLEKEYPGFKGECKWAIATDLSSEELFVKYGDELEKYNPVILLSKLPYAQSYYQEPYIYELLHYNH